jgi:dynein heavy chain
VAQKTALLQEKKKILQGVINKIASLEQSFNDCIEKKEKLTKNIQECEIKLDRAKKLTSGLSGEKSRWEREVARLQSLAQYIPGNSLLSAAMVSYGGAFTAKYRQELHEAWLKKILEEQIPVEDGTGLVKFLGKPVCIQQWTVCGLPKD